MKKCTNCSEIMEEGYRMKMDNAPLAKLVLYKERKKFLFQAYVCQKCGKIDFYVFNK